MNNSNLKKEKKKIYFPAIISLILIISFPVGILMLISPLDSIWWYCLRTLKFSNTSMRWLGFIDSAIIVAYYFSGFILAVFSIIRITISKGKFRGIGLSVIALLLFVLLIVSSFWYLEINLAAHQSEAKTNNLAILEKQKNFKIKNGRYANTFKELGWTPKGYIQYDYFISPEGCIQPKIFQLDADCNTPSDGWPFPEEQKTYFNDNAFIVLSFGNIDRDPCMDIWTINEKGEQKNLVNDIFCYDESDSREMLNGHFYRIYFKHRLKDFEELLLMPIDSLNWPNDKNKSSSTGR